VAGVDGLTEYEAHVDGFDMVALVSMSGRSCSPASVVADDAALTRHTPTVELLRFLTANDSPRYIVSGGGRPFIRPVSGGIWETPGAGESERGRGCCA
jgi:hypothetical protein